MAAVTVSIKMKIKHFYVSIRVHEYCQLKCVSFTAAEPSMVRYIGLLNLDIAWNIIERGWGVKRGRKNRGEAQNCAIKRL
jgi:hypothetical protein